MTDPVIRARLTLDTSGYQAGVAQAQGATSKFGRIKDTMAGVFGGNLLTGAAVQVGNFFKGSVKGALAAEDSNVKFAKTLHNVTGATQAQADAQLKALDAMSRSAAVSKAELRPAYDTLLRGTKSASGAQKALKIALDVSAGSGKPLATVTQAMTKAFLGNASGLQRLGIQTKQTGPNLAAIARATEANNVASIKYQATVAKYGANSSQAQAAAVKLSSAHDKLTAAQEATKKTTMSTDDVMKSLASTFGGQASKQAGTAAGQMRNAQIQFKQFQVTIGTALMPILLQLVDLFRQFMPILQAVGDWAKKNPTAFKLIAVALLAVVAATKAWSIYQKLAAIATKAWAVAQAIFNAIMDANPIMLIVIAIAALVVGLIFAYKHVDWFRKAVDAVWQAIQTAFHAIIDAAKWLIDWLASNWPTVLAILTGPIGIAVLLIVKNWDKIKEAASAVVDWVKGAFNDMIGFFRGIISTIGSVIGSIANAIKSPINAVINAWNDFHFPKIDLPSQSILGHEIGGGSFGGWKLPHIPTLATGGLIKSPGIAFLHAAEVVVPAAQAGRTGPVVVIQHAQFGDAVDIDTFMDRVAWHQARASA